MTGGVDRLTAALADRYTIERELGAGGMATVYLAHDVKHDRKVAIKVLRPELAAVLGAERFVQEIKTTANLQHPHILPLFDSGEADSFLYYVMPFIEGETLRDKLNRETQLGIEEAVKITTEVADALDYAHRQNVIHRDIKPENILLHDGRPMVADFGIALAVSAAAGGRMTETGLSLGTPHYMSPEQATAEKDLTNRSDIYSLGCVLYEMLTGTPPHLGGSAQQIIMKIVTDTPRPVTELRKSVPPNVAAATAKSLEKLPADRFETAAQFTEALNNPAFALATSGPVAALGLAGRWKRVAIASTAVALLFLVTSLWGWLPQSDRPTGLIGVAGSRPFTLSFALEPAEQVAVDMDQLLFDISNDGETIAWIGAELGSERQVFYRSVRDLAVRSVPGTRGVGNEWVKLSPDGRQVSFQRDGELWAVPLDGSGAPQRIFSGRVWSWTWADDGSFVLGEPYRGLLRLDGPGAEPEVLTRLAGEDVTHQFPQVLPDGHSILFSVGQGFFHSTRIEVLTSDGDATRRKVVIDNAYSATYVASGHLVFGRGDQILAVPFDLESLSVTGPETALVSGVQTDGAGPVTEFAVSRNGTLVYLPDQGLLDFRLAWVERDGGIDWLGVPAAPFWNPIVAPDGKAVAVSTRFENDQQRQIYVIDLERLVSRRMTGGAVHDGVVWSPDGEDLVFNSTRDGHLNIYRAPVSGGAAIRLTTSAFDQIPRDWSRDGRLVFLERLPYDKARILALSPADPDPIDTLIAAEAGNSVWGGALSPDGKLLAFVKDGQVFVLGIAGEGRAASREEQVSTTGGQGPRWRPDGRALFYGSQDGRRILAVSVDASAGLRLGRETEVFVAPDGIELSLVSGFDVAPDGRILVVARETSNVPMQVIVSMNLIGH